MSPKKISRVGLLPRWQRWSSHVFLILCAATGCAFFLKHSLAWPLWNVSARDLLVWHGVTAAFVWAVVGSVLPGHVRAAWNARRNRLTGITLLLVMSCLMLSGLFLYYGSEDIHDFVESLHWIVGFLATGVVPLHLIAGRWLNKRASSAIPR